MHDNFDNFFGDSGRIQCTLSYQLLCLLQWLATHDLEKFKKLISHALNHGLMQELSKVAQASDDDLERMHHSLLDFLEVTELMLNELKQARIEKKARDKKLIPVADQIDGSICDTSIVQHSLSHATEQSDSDPKVNAQEQLFKELLKRWKPIDKNTFN